ncbi:LacI family DNA-binding transcriptional regulator [Tropicimonas isoalkanivorans]|uniref:Transcriptional regulator, LacI family n=1 Tax=Tropicimonas isoalkanivorans TaxID=441112 RepID=A0A1I1MRD3_9RHOB|nr:LacI family DNA-binding transcriptional regulator [Tropicimonas isoalkanivorans]SFC87735.1 transcriptional regulator, LacI family [Tropicimonas isoalkanivorans]
MRKRYASSTDVARLAGVSQSTVSRTFRGDSRVSPEARNKVMEAAQKLEYRPNLLPRIMLTQQSRLVALVVGKMHNPFYARVLERFTKRLQEMKCQVMLAHVDSDDALDAVVPRLSGYRVDAVVSALSVLTEAAADQLIELGVPVISFNTHMRKKGLYTISSDNAPAGREVARHLIAQGAQRLAYLGGPEFNPANVDRRTGFVEEARAHGFEPVLSNDEFSFEGGARQAVRVFAGPNPPDAAFCGDDLIAIGALDALWHSGRPLADPLRIVGFDDIPQAAWAPYQLSSIQQDEEVMIDHALRILDDWYAEAEMPEYLNLLVPGKMVIRRSSVSGIQFPGSHC